MAEHLIPIEYNDSLDPVSFNSALERIKIPNELSCCKNELIHDFNTIWAYFFGATQILNNALKISNTPQERELIFRDFGTILTAQKKHIHFLFNTLDPKIYCDEYVLPATIARFELLSASKDRQGAIKWCNEVLTIDLPVCFNQYIAKEPVCYFSNLNKDLPLFNDFTLNMRTNNISGN